MPEVHYIAMMHMSVDSMVAMEQGIRDFLLDVCKFLLLCGSTCVCIIRLPSNQRDTEDT